MDWRALKSKAIPRARAGVGSRDGPWFTRGMKAGVHSVDSPEGKNEYVEPILNRRSDWVTASAGALKKPSNGRYVSNKDQFSESTLNAIKFVSGRHIRRGHHGGARDRAVRRGRKGGRPPDGRARSERRRSLDSEKALNGYRAPQRRIVRCKIARNPCCGAILCGQWATSS